MVKKSRVFVSWIIRGSPFIGIPRLWRLMKLLYALKYGG